MRLSKLKISNFRCYGPTETVIDFENIKTFIGANSSGKSASLQALTKLSGETNAERTFEKSDFYVSYDEVLEDIDSRELYIEAKYERTHKFGGLYFLMQIIMITILKRGQAFLMPVPVNLK